MFQPQLGDHRGLIDISGSAGTMDGLTHLLLWPAAGPPYG